jgi:hypothetical protein
MAINYIDNDYTINLNSKTLNQGREASKITYSISSSISSSQQISSSTLNFATQSVNTYTEDTDESSEAYVFFGKSVAIVNSRKILIGAPNKNHVGYTGGGDVGSVFEFVRTDDVYDADGSEWVQTAEISASDMASMKPGTHIMHFGGTLAASGSYMVAGAPERSGPSGSYVGTCGAVYVFNSSSNGYIQEAFFQPIVVSSTRFGQVLTMDSQSNRFVVGIPYREEAYIYNSSSAGWVQERILTSSLGYASAKFGSSVALSGAYMAVGGPVDRVGSGGSTISGAGKVSLFKSSSVDGWSEIGQISSSSPSSNGFFGRSLSMISNKRLVVGEEFGEIGAGAKTGSIEILSFDDSGGKTLIQAISNPRANNLGRFGRYVSAYENGEYIAVSRPVSTDSGTSDSSSNEGHRAVFIYESGSSGTWSLSKTLTRDTSLATYYSGIGKWIYTLDNSVDVVNKWDSKLDIKGGLVLHGIDGAPDSNFRDLDNTGMYNYGFGEFRTWRTYVSSSTITVTSSVETQISSSSPSDFVPFRFHSGGALNIRGQSTTKGYKTFIGDQKS